MATAHPRRLDASLAKLGYTAFQPGQEAAIRTLLAGSDVLAVLPTGGGKSLIYQLTSQLLPGITVVISPLIALMQDQADAAASLGLEARIITSHKTQATIQDQLQDVSEGRAKLLYITPERLQNEQFIAWLAGQEVSLLVVDEAHCISEWGHDFRPAYRSITPLFEQLQRPVLLALTATATTFVLHDIAKGLHMEQPKIIVHGVDRPNLFYAVHTATYEDEKHDILKRLFEAPSQGYQPSALPQGSGIIYTATTGMAEEIARWLQRWGLAADYYHGQQHKEQRERVQQAFMQDQLQVVVATNAFGMGIDKPDIRFVIHYDIPGTLESYYQEAGRAGRDGDPSTCILIYRSEDMGRAAFLTGSGKEDQKQYEQGRQEMMRRYAELSDCRRIFLLNYFGEQYDAPACGHCDNDSAPAPASAVEPVVASPFAEGDAVRHAEWGDGVVQRIEPMQIMVLFETVGHKMLDTQVVQDQHLLQTL